MSFVIFSAAAGANVLNVLLSFFVKQAVMTTFAVLSDPRAVICTVDVVLLTLKEGALHAVLLRRQEPPHEGKLALPGGYIHAQDDANAWAAAQRVLFEKTCIKSPYLAQLATYSGAKRDPRGWSMSVVYYALVALALVPEQDPRLSLAPVNRLPALAFDHASMVDLAVSRVRSKSQYSSLPVYLCGERFTLPRLQAIYEAVLGEAINKVSFRRKVHELGMLEPLEGEFEAGEAHRPAQVYTLRPAYKHELSTVLRGINA